MTLREKLAQAEDRLRALRDERQRLSRVWNAAKESYGEHGSDQALDAANAAKQAVEAVEGKIEKTEAEQVSLLKRVGDRESGFPGFTAPGLNGWDEAARRLSLSEGSLRVDVSAQSLLQPRPTPLPTTPDDDTIVGPGPANRFLFPVLESLPFSGGDFVSSDFVVTFAEAELTGLSGVERDVDAVTGKAELNPTITLADVAAKQYACVLDDVPAKVFDSQDALRSMLSSELGRQLAQRFDEAVIDAIEAASPPSGSTGSDLVAKIRNAIASMRDLGGDPRVVALTPSDAALLDLTTDDGGYVFRVDLEGSGSPVWTLRVRETPTVTAPTLVGPALAVVYLGEGAVLTDPYTGMKNNLVRVRAEIEARPHVRNVVQGAYQIA